MNAASFADHDRKDEALAEKLKAARKVRTILARIPDLPDPPFLSFAPARES